MAIRIGVAVSEVVRLDNIDLEGRIDLAYERGRYELTAEGFAQQGNNPA